MLAFVLKSQFKQCISSDKYLSTFQIPNKSEAALNNYTNLEWFALTSLHALDDGRDEFLNFYQYINLWLLVFAWKKSSINSPFIVENAFTGVIETVANHKSLMRNSARNMYYLILELANNDNLRNVDFI